MVKMTLAKGAASAEVGPFEAVALQVFAQPRGAPASADQKRFSRAFSASTVGRSMRPAGAKVAMRVTLAARSGKLPVQHASGAGLSLRYRHKRAPARPCNLPPKA
jgi:hypothetical protein